VHSFSFGSVRQWLPLDPPLFEPLDPLELPERLPVFDPLDPLIPESLCDPLSPCEDPLSLCDPLSLDDPRFSSPYPEPEPVELLPRDAFEPLDPLIPPLDPPEFELLSSPAFPVSGVLRGLLVLLEPERDPLLPELPEPLIPPDPLELPDDPDEPWLLLSFAIRPPAFSGALIKQLQHISRSNASAAP
jgi:hypothetical protein